MLPFSYEQFFAVFGRYNQAIWPGQILAYLIVLIPVGELLLKGKASRSLAGTLSLMWAFTGIFYHLVFFETLNPAAKFFGAAFVLQSALFAIAAMAGSLQAELRVVGAKAWVGWGLIAYAALAYPIWALVSHPYPDTPLFGVAPCPLTIFTFGCLLLARRVPVWLLIVPTLWSLVGGSAAVLLHVPQDWLLLISGVLTCLFVAFSRDANAAEAEPM